MMPRPRWFVALALVSALLASCGRAPLPPRLAGLTRTRVWSGASAARLVAELHGKQVAPPASTVAEYGTRGELRVYLAHFANGASARQALRGMLAGLASGATAFSPPREESGAPGRWSTVGPGGHHLLWMCDSTLYWVAGDPDHVLRAAGELPAPSTGRWT
jgi:hypothetical protein